MPALQDTVYNFYTSGPGKGLQMAILSWQHDQGYISPSITLNWMAIAQDIGVKYHGDLDMQNGFATGKYSISSGSPFTDMTMTAGNIGGTNIGYYAGNMGSISAEPLSGFTLDRLMTASSGTLFYVQFIGDCYDAVSGYDVGIDGTRYVLSWTLQEAAGEDPALTYSLTSEALPEFVDSETYAITWIAKE